MIAGFKRFVKGKLRSFYVAKIDGRFKVSLNHNDIKDVAHVVAKAFVPQTNLYLKFKDGNKQNVVAENLEWSSQRYSLSDKIKKEAALQYINGKECLDKVAAKYGMSRGTLKTAVKNNGGKIRSNGGWRDYDKIKAIAKEYANGVPVKQLAEKYSVCGRIIGNYVRDNSVRLISIAERLGHTDEMKKDVIRLYDSGLTCYGISKLKNVNVYWARMVIADRDRANEIYKGIKIKGGRGKYFGSKGMVETRFGKIRYDSCYERDRIIQNSSNSDIKNMARCKLQIMYFDGHRHRQYRPDFFIEKLDGSFVIEEVKPSTMLHEHNNPLKYSAARKYCMENKYLFSSITELEIYGKRKSQ